MRVSVEVGDLVESTLGSQAGWLHQTLNFVADQLSRETVDLSPSEWKYLLQVDKLVPLEASGILGDAANSISSKILAASQLGVLREKHEVDVLRLTKKLSGYTPLQIWKVLSLLQWVHRFSDVLRPADPWWEEAFRANVRVRKPKRVRRRS